MSAQPILSAEQVAYRYAGSAAAVGPFDFEARAGEFHLISGPSGCGKSTLARVLCGAIPHLYRGRLTGRVRIGGHSSAEVPLWHLSTQVGLVSQNPAAQILAATVRDEIIFGLENAGVAADEINRRVEQMLEGFGLRALADRDPRTLSAGEQQKLVLAALIARRPAMLVLDEPVSMLDRTAAAEVADHVRALSSDGMAVVAFEHCPTVFNGVPHIKHQHLPGSERPERAYPAVRARVPAFRLVVEGLGVCLGGCKVLDNIDLELSGGQVVALVGANGCGKTTLLRALVGLQSHAGHVSLKGSASGLRLGLCFDNPDRQIFNPSVRAEILYGLAAHDEGFYRSVLDLLGLAAYEHTPPLLLSHGEKKRLAVAIALLRPGLCGLCLDEPTLGQDRSQRRLLGGILRALATAGYLCVVATHDHEWASQWSDRVLVLRAGAMLSCARMKAPTAPDIAARVLPEAQLSEAHATRSQLLAS